MWLWIDFDGLWWAKFGMLWWLWADFGGYGYNGGGRWFGYGGSGWVLGYFNLLYILFNVLYGKIKYLIQVNCKTVY